ncbi:DUF881 domain-containing protein [Ammoniphilus sp. 3BR4]|uniref:DUF881 domain-containing protein n=1 Tax=Ammoniphilus sp. 3BR4 TaxID=3158265 RepID=UPI003465DB91
MKLRKIHVNIGLVALVLGFMISFSVKYTQQMQALQTVPEKQLDKKQEIQEQIIKEQVKKQQLTDQLMAAKQQVTEMEKKLASNEAHGQALLKQLETLRMWGGTVPVEGRGVAVTLTENAHAKDNPGSDASVREENLRQIINELFAAGAEAVSLNGQRLTTHSAVIYSGLVMLVNDTSINAPYEILAIGDPTILKTAMEMPGGVLQHLRQYSKVAIQIEKRDKVEVPAFTGGSM